MSPIDLLQINVNEHTEKKNGLTYLSWAWAWAKVLIADPKAIYEVQFFQSQDGKPQCYMDVNGTAMVWVTVTMFGKPIACQLPVMDYRNKPIPKPDAFAVNTAIMRCLTKAIALHGLGLYIQANELADVLAVRKFPDGSNMLEWMHTYGHLKKVPTNIVLMTFDPKNQIQLDELNLLIADQKGVALEDLAISDSAADKKESQQPKTKWDKAREEKAASKEEVEVKATASVDLTPSEMRSRADALYKEAARLRKEADTIDPPKKKAKETTEA